MMLKSEIKVGKCYQGKSGQIRKIYDFPIRRRFVQGYESLYVLYSVESGPHKGHLGGMYLDSFASWAKSEVKED